MMKESCRGAGERGRGRVEWRVGRGSGSRESDARSSSAAVLDGVVGYGTRCSSVKLTGVVVSEV